MTGLDVLHSRTRPDRAWSRGNIGEALPGLFTPLAWSVAGPAVDRGVRGGFRSIGVLSAREVFSSPDDPDLNISTIFYGYSASNLAVFRGFADRMPGVSAGKIERQLLGTVRPEVADAPTRRYYPRIAVKMPLGVALAPSRLRRARRYGHRWWADRLAELPGADLSAALAVLDAAERRFAHVMVLHTVVSMVASGLYEQLQALTEAARCSQHLPDLVTGYGGMEETRISALLWQVSRGATGLDEFLAEFGFHGPSAGQLASRMWREDPAPLHVLLTRLTAMSDTEAPRERERGQRARRTAAEATLLAGLPPLARLRARLMLRLARTFVPARETGKAGWLQMLDVARAACRRIGELHAAEGLIDTGDDVFFLVRGELAAPGADARARVAERRAAHRRCALLHVPFWWTGNLTLDEVTPAEADRPTRLSGLGAYGGRVEGNAVVAQDPADLDLGPDDVLVCHTTDPAWIPHFLTAAAVVIEVGGAMSHGVIAARELGVVCVVGIGDATRTIRDGDRIRVDGTSGTVEILQPARGA